MTTVVALSPTTMNGARKAGCTLLLSMSASILLAQHPLAGLEGALIERLSLGQPALGSIELRQIVHTYQRVGVLLAQHPLAGLERALIERLSLGQPPLGSIELGQSVHASQRVGVLLAQHPL